MSILIGDTAPDFTLLTQAGEPLTLSDAWRDSPVVLVFFPAAFSGRCQAELCELRDNIGAFESAGVRIIGISVDNHNSLRAWAAEQGYTFDLVADFWPHGDVARTFGAFVEERGVATRASFLIDREGVIRWCVVNDTTSSRSLDGYREALALVA